MCGIMGFQIIKPERRIPPMMSVLISYMEERGTHAWGCWTATKGVQKGLGAFSKNGPPARAFRGTTNMFGHCRFATVGENTQRNAHPFTSGEITGIHNGSVGNYAELNKKYDRKFQVDSEHIFAHIDEGKDLDELHGYGTVTYIDKQKPERTYLFHWNGGQLAAAKLILDSGEVLGSVWASVEHQLEKAINSAGFRKYQMWSIPEDTLHYFEKGNLFVEDGKMGFGYRANIGGKSTHHHGDGKKVSGGKVVSGQTELMRTSHSSETEKSSSPMGPSSPYVRTTMIPSAVLKAGAQDTVCSDCQRKGFAIEFNETGIMLDPVCWMKWKREEEDVLVEKATIDRLAKKLENNRVILPDVNNSNIVVWTDPNGGVHAEGIR